MKGRGKSSSAAAAAAAISREWQGWCTLLVGTIPDTRQSVHLDMQRQRGTPGQSLYGKLTSASDAKNA